MIIIIVCVAIQWDLVCDRAYLVTTSQTVLAAGVMTGAFMTGMISDLIGRKPVFIGSVFGISIAGLISVFVQNYTAFAVLCFIRGFFQQVMQFRSSTQTLPAAFHDADC